MDRINKTKQILERVRGCHIPNRERISLAIELAGLILDEANATQTHKEKQRQAELARMMDDPSGKLFFTSMTDQSFRTKNPIRVADQIVFLLKKYGIPNFLTYTKKLSLFAFKMLGNTFPKILAPMAKEMIHSETKSVILPGESKELKKHIEKRQSEGVRINLNHLGEAILGEEEAEQRLQIYLDDLAKPEIEYISVKASTIFSQINSLAWEETVTVISERLRKLYQTAQAHQFVNAKGDHFPKFVNLDMEEYRDLHLTVDAFMRVLSEPEFHNHAAGIVLQSYLPDSFPIQQQLTEWARERVKKKGAPIKIRIVKGANLAMEKVEASLRGWEQASYMTKAETDANYKRMLLYGTKQENAIAVRIGVASHNLFDIAYALILRSENQVESYITFEMLEGMADHLRRAVQHISGDMLLYCPAATLDEFQNAVAYLVRRLDENTAPENFLRHSFNLQKDSEEWEEQARLFKLACESYDIPSTLPRRTQNRLEETFDPIAEDSSFQNEADTDWSLSVNRLWAEKILESWRDRKYPLIPLVIGGNHLLPSGSFAFGEDPAFPGKKLYQYALANESQANQALQAALQAKAQWGKTTVEERSKLLAKVAEGLRKNRADLIGAMVADTGKVISEADVEVSEAVDFADYYRINLEEISTLNDIKWHPKGVILVAPPWNFPCSIPAGSILGALAAGNCVIFKPARESILVGWHLAQIFWEAGISKSVMQFIACDDDSVGSYLVKDPRLDTVLLTGGTSTAKLMLKMRPGINLIAETGGKNAIIVTNLADRDLAIKNIIQSAFGHSGQKCSACSLAILHAELYDDPHFLNQLRDAAASLKVGSQWDLTTKVNPLIHEPNPILLRGLTSLEEGEQWLLQPRQDPNNPNLWSPGIKLGVTPESFTYKNELFGPVLAVMRADNLRHSLELANGTQYGLTAGLQSLDEREQRIWLKHIEAGNCYINRTITGAIVQRQPFGGCKESSFGISVKAGGPNYVMNLMRPEQIDEPENRISLKACSKEASALISHVKKNKFLSASEMEYVAIAAESYAFFWHFYFSRKLDPNNILGQDNFLYYAPQKNIVLRVMQKDNFKDIILASIAAILCKAKLQISCEFDLSVKKKFPHLKFIVETEEEFIKRIESDEINRIRFLSEPSEQLLLTMANQSCNINISPIISNGRIELLKCLREVSVSYDYHRYGYLGERENINKINCQPGCCGGGCV